MAQVARTELEIENVVVAPHTTATVAVGRLLLGLAPDVDDRRRRPARLPRGASRSSRAAAARSSPATRSTSSASTATRARIPLDPETGQVVGGERAHVAFACSAMRVVVEVDVDLGLTRVVWIGTAQDVGKAVNPQAVHGQIEGGTAQGLGLALMEEIQTRDGLITNASFTDYLIPTALDMPPVVAELVEEPEPDAPYGVKGVGEPPTVVSTAAIVAALRDATGRELAARAGAPRRDRRPVASGRDRLHRQEPEGDRGLGRRGSGYSPALEARFARRPLETEQVRPRYQRFAPGYRSTVRTPPRDQEEVYVILAGSGRMKLDDDVVEVGRWDAVRVAPEVTRAFEAGPDGAELLVFGAGDGRRRRDPARLVERLRRLTGDSRSRGWRLRRGAGSPRSPLPVLPGTGFGRSRRPAWSQPSPPGAPITGQASERRRA